MNVIASCRRAALLAACLLSAAAWSQAWMPNETLVSPQKDLLDPEYNQARAQFTWSAADGKLWVGNIDRATGLFDPPDGKAILVDADAMTADDVLITLNGPEWVWSAGGDGIAYTKFSASRHSDRSARLAYARAQPDGSFSAGFLGPDVARKAPYGSETVADPRPRVTYVDKDNRHYWRYLDDAASEQVVPGPADTVGPLRHVRGANAVIYVTAVDGVQQAHVRYLDSGEVVQLTTDAGDKSEVWMWPAPEFNGEPVFMAMVGNNELRIYRRPPGATASTLIHRVNSGTKDSFTSPEPFTYRGRSYVFMAMIRDQNLFTSEIWVSNIDATGPIFKRISDNTVLRARTDPEVFVSDRGVHIYYNRRLLDGSPRRPRPCPGVACSEGIYRADAGL